MVYTAKQIANELIDIHLNHEKISDFSPLKIQKLLYYAQGFYLGNTGEKLYEEDFEAWKFGPVLPTIYNEFRDLGHEEIKRYATDIEIDGFKINQNEPRIDSSNVEVSDYLKKIALTYGKYSPIQLSNMTHEKGGPWWEVYEALEFNIVKNTKIPEELIKKHFSDILRKHNQ